MRKSAIGTRISLVLVLVSIIIIIVAFLTKSDVFQNVGYGVLGSSIVSFVVMLSEYFTSKREALERYYIVAIETNNQFLKCQYMHLTRLDFALAELKWIYDTHQILQQAIQDDFFETNKVLIEEICSLLKIPKSTPRDNDLISKFLEVFEKENVKIREIMHQYVSLAEYKRLEFENAFGNLYFMCDVKKKQKWLFENIHNPLQKKHGEIQNSCRHIHGYLSGKITNVPVIYGYLKESIESLYDVQSNENGQIVYPVFFNDILNRLEQLRCDTYHEEYRNIEPSPVYAEGAFMGAFMDAASIQQQEE